MQIDNLPINDVIPYVRNPRNNDQAVAKVAGSLNEFGWQQPIVVDEFMVVVAGHTRLAAARYLGMDRIPVHVAKNLTPEQVKAYRIADNRVAEEAEWDHELLRLELGELESMDFTLDLTGFDSDELMALMADPFEGGETDPDDVPEPPKDAVTRPGDLWMLGRHRLLCGDSTSATDVAKCLNGVEPHLMVTDPPYHVTPGSKTHYEKPGMIKGGWMGTDYPVNSSEMFEVPEFADWMPLTWASLSPNSDAYIMSNDRNLAEISDAAKAAGWKYHNTLIWQKPSGIPNRWYFKDVEFSLYLFRGKAKTIRMKSSTQTFRCKHTSERVHMSQKPVELFEHYILNSSDLGQSVYDPFLGSGTTIIAAEMTGRVCHGLELSPEYCDIIVQRWENFTGKKAERVAPGQG
jgi:DNA modification methylase